MTDAPETIWVQFGRRGELVGDDSPGQKPVPQIQGAYYEYRRADLPPKVKPLEWKKISKQTAWARARYVADIYIIEDRLHGGHFDLWITHDAPSAVRFSTLDEAKAAAQSDYERRILSALEV